MRKSKVFLALGAVILLIACCSAAGCILIDFDENDDSNKQSTNDVSIVGVWKDNDNPGFYYEFRNDGTMETYCIDQDGNYMVTENNTWYKYNKDSYEGYKNLYAVTIADDMIEIYSVSDDGKKITLVLFTDDLLKSANPTATRHHQLNIDTLLHLPT